MKSVRESQERNLTEIDRSLQDQQYSELKETIVGILNSSEDFVMDLVRKVSSEIEDSVKENSEHISQRLIALKNEISLSKHVQEHPWRWIGISALAGFSLRLLASSSNSRRNISIEAGHRVPGKSILASATLPILTIAIEEFGSRLLKNAANRKSRTEQSH